MDLSKRQALDADPRANQQISFTGNLDRAAGAFVFFICEETKETILDFSQGTSKSIVNILYNSLIWFNIKNDSKQ